MATPDGSTSVAPGSPPDAAGRARRPPVLEVEGIVTRFGRTTIHDGVSFAVARGQVLAIIGGSGTGKSVLLREIIGLLRPTAGTVRLLGTDVWAASPEDLARLRARFGMMFQDGALFSSLSVADNVATPLKEHAELPPRLLDPLVRLRIAMAGLPPDAGAKMPSELSGGMRKRAGLARAMALDPMFLFFDEPWAGLDPVTAAELDILIRSINEGIGTTMVFVTQELASIFNLGQRVIMLHKDTKGIIARGTPAELREKSTDSRVMNFFNRHAV